MQTYFLRRLFCIPAYNVLTLINVYYLQLTDHGAAGVIILHVLNRVAMEPLQGNRIDMSHAEYTTNKTQQHEQH